MAPELHLDPDRLRDQAAVATALADELAAALVVPPPDDPDAGRLHATAVRAARELADVGSALFGAAETACSADGAVARGLALR